LGSKGQRTTTNSIDDDRQKTLTNPNPQNQMLIHEYHTEKNPEKTLPGRPKAIKASQGDVTNSPQKKGEKLQKKGEKFQKKGEKFERIETPEIVGKKNYSSRLQSQKSQKSLGAPSNEF
jgi:hypothetical protein